MKKYLLTACLLGTVSQVSAAAAADGVGVGPLSPVGHHGAKNGGMSKTVYQSCDELTVTFPPAVRIKRLAADGVTFIESIFPISRATRVADFKAELLNSLRVLAASRYMYNGAEIMKESVNEDGTLITLASVFSGIAGIPTIEIVKDSSRSPMLTPAPQPAGDGKISPLSKSPDAE